MQWRKRHELPEGFDMLKKHKPAVAHPQHTSPAETWLHVFEPPPEAPSDDPITTTATIATHDNPPATTHLFTPCYKPAVDEILTILSTSAPGTITLIAIGPLTNFALAAAKSPQTFLRAKAVLVMGGAIDEPGNITPVGEFNCLADPIAAARVFALTSPDPRSTMPPISAEGIRALGPYPQKEHLGQKRLNVIMFPLDITTPHTICQAEVDAITNPLIAQGSPLAEWFSAFTSSTFRKNASLQEDDGALMSMHDPVVVWYALKCSDARWCIRRDEDIRVETAGQWTRGMCIVDRRGRKRLEQAEDMEGDGDDKGIGDDATLRHWILPTYSSSARASSPLFLPSQDNSPQALPAPSSLGEPPDKLEAEEAALRTLISRRFFLLRERRIMPRPIRRMRAKRLIKSAIRADASIPKVSK
ncbi:MAG: hypothetical protein Q9217_000892 [Psora testacea]